MRETKAIQEVLSHADVILATLTSATGDGPLKHVASKYFDVVVIDECSQVGLSLFIFIKLHVTYFLFLFCVHRQPRQRVG